MKLFYFKSDREMFEHILNGGLVGYGYEEKYYDPSFGHHLYMKLNEHGNVVMEDGTECYLYSCLSKHEYDKPFDYNKTFGVEIDE